MIDHLVYGTPDLAATVQELNQRWGIELTPGGQHLGLGTRNYLADLGARRYLEVVGPDLSQPEADGPRFFGVDRLDRARLVTWAVRVDDLDATRRRIGTLPEPRDMRRAAADGTSVTWRMTAPMSDPTFGGLVPFAIEWGEGSPHPADTAARGLRLVSLTVYAPDVAGLRGRLDVLDPDVPVEAADVPGLRAVLQTPNGQVVLD